MQEVSTASYWIASNALYITLNANGAPNYILGNTASGAHILCYVKGVDGLEYDAAHNYRRWPLSLTPTKFNTNTEKYVYVAIPRPTNPETTAVVVFPSEKLDLYGKNEAGRQIGSELYYYVWLRGIITATNAGETLERDWQQHFETGTLSSDEAIDAGGDQTWWRYSSVDDTVTFLKEILMDSKSFFHNLKTRLLVLAGHELTGVATAETSEEFVDSETLVVTPNYLKKNTEDKFLRKDQDDATPYSLTVGGNLSVGGILRAVTGYFTSLYSNLVQSTNYTGDGIADTGYRLTADDGTGSSALTVDNLHVRKKATFEELEVKKETSVAGNEIRSAAANVINRTDYIDQNGEIIGYSYHTVPWMLRKMPFLLRHKFFGRLRRVRITIDPEHVGDIKKIRCYFLAKDGDRDVKNLWQAHDLVRCQTFNISRSNRFTYIGAASQSKFGNVFWWRKALLVSTSPVVIDDKEYHYFDVSMDDCAAGSDIPCAGDHAVQFGNDSDDERMNLIIQEVNGDDAPAIKAYTGIYTYDLNKCWWGGSPRKMMLSPKSGYEFSGPSFKFIQEYGQAPASIDRGVYTEIATERDDYAPHNQVRKLYYYDKVSHNGCYWLCVMTGVGAHWVAKVAFTETVGGTTYTFSAGDYIPDNVYSGLVTNKTNCTRKENYTTEAPSETSTSWKKLVNSGDNMIRLDIDNELDAVQTDSTCKVTAQRTITTNVRLYDGATEVAINNPTVTGISYTDANGQQQTLNPVITASGNGKQLSWTFLAGWTLQARYQVNISYTYLDVPYTAVFTLTASQGFEVLQLKPSLSSISFQRDASNQLTPASRTLGLSIVKIDGASTADITPATYGVSKIRYSLTEMPALISSGSAWPAAGTITVPNTAENVYIALFNIFDVLIDRETVPVIKDGEKGAKGDKPVEGVDYTVRDGKDASNVMVTPASMIIEQSLSNTNNIAPAAANNLGQFSIQIFKGSTACTITSITATASKTGNNPHVYISESASDGCYQSRTWQPNNTTANMYLKGVGSSGGNYYDNGQVTLSITYTDPDDGSKTISGVIVRVYVNLLGSWKESVEEGVKHEVATAKFYFEDENGNVVAHETIGDFIKSSTENISRLEARSESRNMLDCASGDGWRNWGDDSDTPYDNSVQKIGDVPEIDSYSKAVFLKAGVTYVFSVYASYEPEMVLRRCNNNPNATHSQLGASIGLGDEIKSGDTYQNCARYYDSFTPQYSDYYKVNVYSSDLVSFYRPQLEVGTTPTDWVPSTLKNSSSEIKQTADEIEAKVNDTGVRINDGYIDLMAGRVNFVDSNGDPFQTPKIVIDPTTGALYAVDGVFSGKVESASTKGKWVIEPHIGNNAVPRISGQDGNGNEKVVIFFDADDFDSTYVRDGGGMLFTDAGNDGSLSSRFCRNAWRTNCSHYGEKDQNTHKTRTTYISSLAEHSNPRLHFYDNYDGSVHSLTVGLNLNGAFLSGDWLSKSQATANGMTYVDDWGNVKVKRSSGYEQYNFVYGQSGSEINVIKLPKNTSSNPIPDGTMYFVKGNGSSWLGCESPIMNSHNGSYWPLASGYYSNMIYGQSHIFLMQTVNGTKVWIDFYTSAQESPD